jgi:hypothetical protein
MGPGISEVLPFAIGVAVCPVPIIATILILFSPRARANGAVFLLGWMLSLAVVSGLVYVATDSAGAATDSGTSDTVSWMKIGLGVVLLALARRDWAKRPRPGEPEPLPKWMGAVDTLTPVRAFGLAVLLAAVNPKNLALTVAAAAGLGQLPGLSTADAVVALAVFVVLASVTIAGPVLYDLIGGDGARARLDEWKSWLSVHNSAVMAVLLLVFGVVLISKGLAPLSR